MYSDLSKKALLECVEVIEKYSRLMDKDSMMITLLVGAGLAQISYGIIQEERGEKDHGIAELFVKDLRELLCDG